MAPSNPRVKRAFQPTIDSYFSASSAPDHRPTTTPLPNNVQSSLLSVGMRVRKAVPEGYKTHKTLPDDLDHVPVAATITTARTAAAAQPAPPRRPAELLPFCGILKTGNLAVQDTYDDPVDAYGLATSDVTPFSSQGSNDSSDSMPAGRPGNVRKRVLYDDDDDEDAEEEMMAPEAGSRAFAVPRGGRRMAAAQGHGRMASGDFGEAEFLRPMEWEGEEMEMGG